jgi:hypothetical protein
MVRFYWWQAIVNSLPAIVLYLGFLVLSKESKQLRGGKKGYIPLIS